MTKSRFAYSSHRAGDINASEIIAIIEGSPCNGGHTFGDDRVLAARDQGVGTSLDDGIAIVRRAVRLVTFVNRDLSQTRASRERIIINRCDGTGDDN